MSSCRDTQNARLIAYLKKHRSITRAPAFFELGIANLWARVGELRKLGYRIDDDWTTTANGAHVKEYWLRTAVKARKAA